MLQTVIVSNTERTLAKTLTKFTNALIPIGKRRNMYLVSVAFCTSSYSLHALVKLYHHFCSKQASFRPLVFLVYTSNCVSLHVSLI